MTTATTHRTNPRKNRVQHACAAFSAATLLLLGPIALAAQGSPAGASGANAAPAGTINCGPHTVNGSWRDGAIYGDASSLASKSLQSVASGWCSYLGTGMFAESADFVAQWIDAQLSENLPLDIGVEWARQHLSDARVRFRVVQTDTSNKERFFVTTTFESADGAAWRTLGVHKIAAYVYKDTVRFESAVGPRLPYAARWIATPLQYIRLDSGVVDQARASAAAAFVSDVRQRAGIVSPPGEQVSYFYSKSGNGSALLGFSELTTTMSGLAHTNPVFVFSNVADAGELNRHELVRIALMAHTRTANSTFDEALANALGGVRNRTWAQAVCEDRSPILDREGMKDIPSLLSKAEPLSGVDTRDWENALLIEYLITKKGDAGLRALIARDRNFSTRAAARTAVSEVLGVSAESLGQAVAAYNTNEMLASRCGKK